MRSACRISKAIIQTVLTFSTHIYSSPRTVMRMRLIVTLLSKSLSCHIWLTYLALLVSVIRLWSVTLFTVFFLIYENSSFFFHWFCLTNITVGFVGLIFKGQSHNKKCDSYWDSFHKIDDSLTVFRKEMP